jgi:lipopolysaccharide transport system ATP-binding protein
MSDTIIKVENLSKKYIIGHQQEGRSNYTALRDVISNGAKSLIQKIKHPTKSNNNKYEEFWALDDVSFEIKRGEAVGIIGRNGAGKSTLLKILSRITEPTKGKVSIKGRVASLLEVGTGFHPELTGRENIYLNGAILGMSRLEIKKKFDEIVDFAEVEKFLDTPVKRYSSGMYVRLAFAVAAHLEPEILVVDEVLAVGDAAFQKKCLGKMGDVAEKEGRTVLFVSHQMAAILSLCNKGYLLHQGKLIDKGSTQAVINKYLESTVYNYSQPLKDRKDRQGDGTARFTSIKVNSDDNKETIFCNSRLEITIGYSSCESLHNATFAIGIFDISNVEIYFLDSDSTRELPNMLPSEGEIKCCIDSINLTPGECYINIALVKGGLLEGGSIIDYVQNAISFTVEPIDFYRSGKLPPRSWSMCLIQHKWKLI